MTERPDASMAAEDQRARALEALRSGPKTSNDLRRVGLYQAPTRIFELRERGYEITSDPVTVIDADGFPHSGVALYTLISEPLMEAEK